MNRELIEYCALVLNKLGFDESANSLTETLNVLEKHGFIIYVEPIYDKEHNELICWNGVFYKPLECRAMFPLEQFTGNETREEAYLDVFKYIINKLGVDIDIDIDDYQKTKFESNVVYVVGEPGCGMSRYTIRDCVHLANSGCECLFIANDSSIETIRNYFERQIEHDNLSKEDLSMFVTSGYSELTDIDTLVECIRLSISHSQNGFNIVFIERINSIWPDAIYSSRLSDELISHFPDIKFVIGFGLKPNTTEEYLNDLKEIYQSNCIIHCSSDKCGNINYKFIKNCDEWQNQLYLDSGSFDSSYFNN